MPILTDPHSVRADYLEPSSNRSMRQNSTDRAMSSTWRSQGVIGTQRLCDAVPFTTHGFLCMSVSSVLGIKDDAFITSEMGDVVGAMLGLDVGARVGGTRCCHAILQA